MISFFAGEREDLMKTIKTITLIIINNKATHIQGRWCRVGREIMDDYLRSEAAKAWAVNPSLSAIRSA